MRPRLCNPGAAIASIPCFHTLDRGRCQLPGGSGDDRLPSANAGLTARDEFGTNWTRFCLCGSDSSLLAKHKVRLSIHHSEVVSMSQAVKSTMLFILLLILAGNATAQGNYQVASVRNPGTITGTVSGRTLGLARSVSLSIKTQRFAIPNHAES